MDVQHYSWLAAITVPAALLCAMTVATCLRRPHLTGRARAGTASLVIAVPVVGSLVYTSFEPAVQARPALAGLPEATPFDASAD